MVPCLVGMMLPRSHPRRRQRDLTEILAVILRHLHLCMMLHFLLPPPPPPRKKVRKPRSCKTCRHELSAKLAVEASGYYTHVWDASARKFAPCECPAEFYHPSISRRRKKNRKHLCSTCKNPIYGTNFREYHIDISTNKRIKCTFFNGRSPGAEELC